MSYECIIIGGGIAGLQAAIQLGRYEHKVLVIDAGFGRSTLCRSYHNILGYPDGISGDELRQMGKEHASTYGVQFLTDEVVEVRKKHKQFEVCTKQPGTYVTERILLATGVLDRLPDWPEIHQCLGLSVYICPDCDGYEVREKKVLVLGSGDAGAQMALVLTNWTRDITFINHEQKSIGSKSKLALEQNGIQVINEEIDKILVREEWQFSGVRLKNGEELRAMHAFVAFGGNHVKTELAEQLGVERVENGHVIVDPRTKMTNVPHVWAAGDMVAHSEQVTIAMGEGTQAAIWIHKSLLNG